MYISEQHSKNSKKTSQIKYNLLHLYNFIFFISISFKIISIAYNMFN